MLTHTYKGNGESGTDALLKEGKPPGVGNIQGDSIRHIVTGIINTVTVACQKIGTMEIISHDSIILVNNMNPGKSANTQMN